VLSSCVINSFFAPLGSTHQPNFSWLGCIHAGYVDLISWRLPCGGRQISV